MLAALALCVYVYVCRRSAVSAEQRNEAKCSSRQCVARPLAGWPTGAGLVRVCALVFMIRSIGLILHRVDLTHNIEARLRQDRAFLKRQQQLVN